MSAAVVLEHLLTSKGPLYNEYLPRGLMCVLAAVGLVYRRP